MPWLEGEMLLCVHPIRPLEAGKLYRVISEREFAGRFLCVAVRLDGKPVPGEFWKWRFERQDRK